MQNTNTLYRRRSWRLVITEVVYASWKVGQLISSLSATLGLQVNQCLKAHFSVVLGEGETSHAVAAKKA